jgi:hypothetical protein
MARKVSQCEYCGDDLGQEVDKWPGEIVVCGKRECLRYERDAYQEEREEAHERLDRDMGYF